MNTTKKRRPFGLLSFARELQFVLQYRILSEKAENSLIALVSLSEHCLTCLLKNIPVGILNHFRSHVGITDTGLSCCGIFNNVVEIADGVLESVLDSTKIGSLSVDLLDSTLDSLDRSLSKAVAANLDSGSGKAKA